MDCVLLLEDCKDREWNYRGWDRESSLQSKQSSGAVDGCCNEWKLNFYTLFWVRDQISKLNEWWYDVVLVVIHRYIDVGQMFLGLVSLRYYVQS